MIYLRQRNYCEAERLFAEGLEHCLFAGPHAYFHAGLAICKLAREDYSDAKALLDQIIGGVKKNSIAMLGLFAAGKLKLDDEVTKIYAEIGVLSNDIEEELMAELQSQFIHHKAAKHNDAWVIEKQAICYVLST